MPLENRKLTHIRRSAKVEPVGVLKVASREDLADDNRAVLACVDCDLAGRIRRRFAHDLDAGLLVVVRGAAPLRCWEGRSRATPPPGTMPYLRNRRTGRMSSRHQRDPCAP